MKSKYLRIISLILAVCMVTSCCAVPAFASDVNSCAIHLSASSGFFANGHQFLGASNRAFDDKVDVFVHAYAGGANRDENDRIPSGSYIEFNYRVAFGRLPDTDPGEFVTLHNFEFINFQGRPPINSVTISAYHDNTMQSHDILYDGPVHSSMTFSTKTARDYYCIVAFVRYSGVLDFAAKNGVVEGDMLLIYALNSSLRYCPYPIPEESVESYVDSQMSTLSAELQAHKDEVSASISDIAGQLDLIYRDIHSTQAFISKIFTELQGFGADVDKALAYLNGISQNTATMVNSLNTVQTYLSSGNDILTSILDSSLAVSTDVSSVLSFMEQLCADVETMRTTGESVESYLSSIDSKLSTVSSRLSSIYTSTSGANTKLGNIYSTLVSMSNDSSSVVDYLATLCESLGTVSENGDSVLDYLSSLDSKFSFLNEKLSSIEKLLSSNGSGGGTVSVDLSEVVSKLISIDKSLSLASGYLLSLSNACANIDGNVSDIEEYVKTSCGTMSDILQSLGTISQQLDAVSTQYLSEILSNLVSQGTDLATIKRAFNHVLGFLQNIAGNTSTSSKNTTAMKTTLENLLTELQTTETKIDDTNERLDAIYKLIEDFEVNIQQDIDKIYSNNDKKGLGGILSSIVSRLSSMVNFVGDVFGNMLTSVPDLIGGFNDSLAFWDSAEHYEYRPYQIGIYTKETADYTNSSAAVQALFAEAEKYLGYPYVWGGASPETSFDCSGYVSYVLNASGVYSTSRLTAQGLYNICTPIDSSQAMPGDLIFFTGTYNTTDTVTHVGFYAGDGRMLHCGDPIQYTDCTTPYFTSHFYSYGRLPYNASEESIFTTDLPQYSYFDLAIVDSEGSYSLNLFVSSSDSNSRYSWETSCYDYSSDCYSDWGGISSDGFRNVLSVYVDADAADRCAAGFPDRYRCIVTDSNGVDHVSTETSIVFDGWEG